MANYNRVMLMGNLTKDPELKYITSGAAVVNLRLAINRNWTSKSGEERKEVCYVGVVVWQKQAENCAKYLHKGSPVFIEGRLQSRSWETDDGQKRSVLEVVADRVQFLSDGKRRTAESGGEEQPESGSNSKKAQDQMDEGSQDEDDGDGVPF